MEYLGITVARNVQDLYGENDRILVGRRKGLE